MTPVPSFAASYMITNRSDPYTLFPDSKSYVRPLPPPQLFYSTAPSMYDQNPDDYSNVTKDPSGFMTLLKRDLAATVDSTGQANLAVYIHGLGNTYDDAVTETAAFGSALSSVGGYRGLLIGFSWPSYGELVSPLASYYATGRPPTNTFGTIRDNINGSTGSFVSLMKLLLALKINSRPVRLNLITHSEGNFMLMLGLTALEQAGAKGGIANALMLAADVSAAMLQQGQWGEPITTLCDTVSVYYSGCDPDVCYSDYEFFSFHDQTYPTRLGLVGPYTYPPATPTPANVVGIDCSQVTVNVGIQTNVHGCYRSLPQTLIDMSTTMSSANPVYTGRTLYPGSESPSYYLDPSANQVVGLSPKQGTYRRRTYLMLR